MYTADQGQSSSPRATTAVHLCRDQDPTELILKGLDRRSHILSAADLSRQGKAPVVGRCRASGARGAPNRHRRRAAGSVRPYEAVTTLVTTHRCLPIMRSRTKPSCS